MSCSSDYVQLLHKYLDHELTLAEEKLVKDHLHSCEACYEHFHELEKAVAFVQSTSHIEAPKNFTEGVMKSLPKEKKTVTWNRWFKGHPLLTAASLFILLMASSLFTAWNEDQHFSVSKQENLVVENSKVIVPRDQVIKGDVIVKNGTLTIEGTIDGNVTVINGEQYMAAAGNVTGEIEEVDEMFEWLWYHIKGISKDVVDVFK